MDVDITSKVYYARVFDFRGIELGKFIKLNNDAEGFKEFAAWIDEIKTRSSEVKVLVVMESIGYYWFINALLIKDHRMKIVLVNPFHVKRSKELDDNIPTENDQKDIP